MNNLNVQPLNMDEGKTDNPPRTKRRNPSGTWTLCYCLVAEARTPMFDPAPRGKPRRIIVVLIYSTVRSAASQAREV